MTVAIPKRLAILLGVVVVVGGVGVGAYLLGKSSGGDDIPGLENTIVLIEGARLLTEAGVAPRP